MDNYLEVIESFVAISKKSNVNQKAALLTASFQKKKNGFISRPFLVFIFVPVVILTLKVNEKKWGNLSRNDKKYHFPKWKTCFHNLRWRIKVEPENQNSKMRTQIDFQGIKTLNLESFFMGQSHLFWKTFY